MLDRCDIVKFAKLRPAIPDCRGLLPLARHVMDVSAPVKPAPPGQQRSRRSRGHDPQARGPRLRPRVLHRHRDDGEGDNTGHYPTRTVLPRPTTFNGGYTRVNWLTHFDVNNDGFQDLLLVHTRLYEGPTDELPNTGRYIQVLINRGGSSFRDETPTWIAGQSATTPEHDAEGNELYNAADPRMHDVDRDGCVDLVMSLNDRVRIESPLVYRNDGSGCSASTTFAGRVASFRRCYPPSSE